MSYPNTQPTNKEWYHYLPTKEQTKALARFVPTPKRQSTIPLRYLIGARRYQNATSCPWHKLPEEFGNSKTIYNRLLGWILSVYFPVFSLEEKYLTII